MFKAVPTSRNHGMHRKQSGQRRRDVFNRALRYEPLEDRHLLSVGGSDIGNISDKVVSISASDTLAGEPSNNGAYLISRTGSTTSPLTVNFAVLGNATRSTTGTGGDYCLRKNGTTLLSGNSVTIDAGQTSVQVIVDIIDDSVHESTETAMLMLQTGSNYDVGTHNSASVSITDNDEDVPSTLPSITVTATTPDAAEPSTNGAFLITRTGATTSALTVFFATDDGDATQGVDYALSDGIRTLTNQVTIAAGQSSVQVNVLVNNDNEWELTETAVLTLEAKTTYDVGTASSATVNIADDDAIVVTVSAADADAGEPSNPGTYLISRAGSTLSDVTVKFSTDDGAAKQGTDYTLSDGSHTLTDEVTIPAGQSSVLVTLQPVDDTDWESTKTATLKVGTGTGYDIGTASSANISIADDDAVVVTVSATVPNAGEPSTRGEFEIRRAGTTDSAITVNFTIGGTATPGGDYQLSDGSGTVTDHVDFAIGQDSVIVTLAVLDDSTSESAETVSLTVGTGTGYLVGTNNVATINIADNDPILVTVSAIDSLAGEPSNNGIFRITRTGSILSALSVNFASGGDASRGTDYTLSSGGSTLTNNAVTIGAGQTYVDVTLNAIDDAISEPTENASLTLQSGAGYEVGIASSAAISITDDDQGQVSVSAVDSLAGEPNNIGVFRITRTGNSATSLIVHFVMDQIVQRGVDYTLYTGWSLADPGTALTENYVTLAAGQTVVDITLVVTDDPDPDPIRTVTMTLTDGTSIANSATITIADDDGPRQTVVAQNVNGVANQTISIPVWYTVTSNDNTLTGLGLRLHYDSSFMRFESLTNVLQTGLVSQQGEVEDPDANGGFDGNTDTDAYVLVAWADLAGNWPNQALPTQLYVANFTLAANVESRLPSTVSFTAASHAADLTFEPLSITVTPAESNLDVDGNGECDALTDGVLIMRYLFDPNGPWTTAGAFTADATRKTHDEVKAYLDSASTMLDVDNSGQPDALTDGMLIMRYLFDRSGSWTTDGLTGTGADRTTQADIKAFLDNYFVSSLQLAPPTVHSKISSTEELSVMSLATPKLGDTARYQIVTPSKTDLSVSPGAHATFDLNYSTSPSDSTLSGLGLRMYYNSSLLTYNGLNNVLANSKISQQDAADDTDNADGDASTDKYVLVAWGDMGQNWPGALSQRLYTADFTLKPGATTATQVNFGASSTAAGWTFVSSPVTITPSPETATLDSRPTISAVTANTARGTIGWKVADAQGVKSVKLWIDGKAAPKVFGPYAAEGGSSYIGTMGLLKKGNHTYWIKATDTLGNATALKGTFVINNSGPAISKACVSAGKITCNVGDPQGVARVRIWIDNKTELKIAGPHSAAIGADYSAAIGKVTRGEHTYTIRAIDKAGNASTIRGSFSSAGVSKVSNSRTLATNAFFETLATTPTSSAKATWFFDDVDDVLAKGAI